MLGLDEDARVIVPVTPGVESWAGLHAGSRDCQLTTLGPEIYWLIVIQLDLAWRTGKQRQQRRHRPSSMTPGGVMEGQWITKIDEAHWFVMCQTGGEGDKQNQSLLLLCLLIRSNQA